MKIAELQFVCHENARSKGWYDGPVNIPEKIAAIHSEASEMFEAFRREQMDITVSETGKPEGFPIELADGLIRILDLAGYLGVDLEKAIAMKMKYNETRPYRHGGKLA